MRRLSIIDLSGGHQPIANHDGSLVVVCNGEIYNFRELRRELQGHGHRFKTDSDSEVVLHGYAQWGERFVERLNGMFGFALWDAPAADAAGRARPPRHQADLLARRRPARRVRLRGQGPAGAARRARARSMPGALAAYLELGYVPAPLSMFRGIRKLPIASVLKVSPAGVSISQLLAAADRGRPGSEPARVGASACASGSRNRCACRW